MKRLLLASTLFAGLIASQSVAATVFDPKSCTQALADARSASEIAHVSDKARTAGEELIVLAETRCGEKNFDAAEQLLAIARGIFAEE